MISKSPPSPIGPLPSGMATKQIWPTSKTSPHREFIKIRDNSLSIKIKGEAIHSQEILIAALLTSNKSSRSLDLESTKRTKISSFQISNSASDQNSRAFSKKTKMYLPFSFKNLGPGQYNTIELINKEGRHNVAKYEDSRCRSFTKSTRFEEIRARTPGPGTCKYFSIFRQVR